MSKTKPLPTKSDLPKPIPLRGTTQMAVQSAFRDFRQVLAGIVQAAVRDGEVPPDGWSLDADQMAWLPVIPANTGEQA